MRKVLVRSLLLLGIVLTPIFVYSYSYSNSSPRFLKPSASKITAIVTELPKGALINRGNSTIKIPPNTVIASPTSKLQGIVAQLNDSTKFNSATSFVNTPQNTKVPSLNWEIYNHGSEYGSFTGVSDATGVYSNFNFSISSSYQLKVDMNVTGANSDTTQYEVFLLDQMVSDGVVYTNVLPVGQSFTVTYPNLNPTHLYYLRWSPVAKNQSINGKYIVHF